MPSNRKSSDSGSRKKSYRSDVVVYKIPASRESLVTTFPKPKVKRPPASLRNDAFFRTEMLLHCADPEFSRLMYDAIRMIDRIGRVSDLQERERLRQRLSSALRTIEIGQTR